MKHENEEITQLTKKINEETTRLTKMLNEFYVFMLQSIRHILNSTSVDKVTYCIKTTLQIKVILNLL